MISKYNFFRLLYIFRDQSRLKKNVLVCVSFSVIAEPKSFSLVVVLCCVGAALLMSLVAVLMFVRYQVAKKKRVSLETTTELEMEVQLPENEDRRVISFFIIAVRKDFMTVNSFYIIKNFVLLIDPLLFVVKTNTSSIMCR